MNIRFSTKFVRAQRRRARYCGSFGVLMALVVLADALHAHINHTMVEMGPGHTSWPPWAAALLGIALLLICLAILSRSGATTYRP
jgi:ABC-type Co2+ transport system permease subunit